MSKRTGEPRDYLAKKWFQLRIALAYLAVIAAGSAIMAAALVPRLGRALRIEMYRGHSTTSNTWDLLLPDVARANVAATAAVLLLAAGITLAVLAAVHRSARRLARDLRAAHCGGDPAAWEPLRRPREFRHLQKLLSEGIRGHRKHLGELDALCAEILERVRDARAAAPERRDLRTVHVLCERLRSHARHIKTE
jgi:hypothetical protein